MSSVSNINNNFFNRLPHVLCSNILTYLDLSDLVNAALSCKMSQNAASDLPTWKGRIARMLASPSPSHLTPNQHRANLQLLAKIRDESIGLNERQILVTAILAIQEKKVCETIPQGLIKALGGFEAYQALPMLDLRGKIDGQEQPLSVLNLAQRDLVNARGVFCPVMRGFFDQAVCEDILTLSVIDWERVIKQRRFIAIAVDTKDIPVVRFVLGFFENSYERTAWDRQDNLDNLGKMTTADLPPNYQLRSNNVQPQDFATVSSIFDGTNPLMTLARRR